MISGRIIAAYRAIISNYAFVPSVLILGGIAVAVTLTVFDIRYEARIQALPFILGPATPDGARGILTTIGGSMLSVAGIVFSITLAAIVFASGQYGPHVLPQYRRDRLAQVTLGVMLAAFAYCMATLYAVGGGETESIPRLAIFGALILAAAGIGLLIFFISHMLSLLHVSNVIARIGGHAIGLMNHEMPLDADGVPGGASLRADRTEPALTREGDPVITANGTGYVLTEATKQLVTLAHANDFRLDVLVRPGDYVTPQTPIARLTKHTNEALTDDIRSAFAYGKMRTPDEDAAFLLDELCAIGLRALSPGINDPFTATDVINQLTAVTERAGRGHEISTMHAGTDGQACVRRPALTFDDVVRLGLDRIANNASENATAAPVMIRAYDTLLCQRHEAKTLKRLRQSAERFGGLCQENLPTDRAKADVKRSLSRVLDRSCADRSGGALRLARVKRDIAGAAE